MVHGGGLVSLLQGRIDIAVAHDVTGAAGGHFVDIHVETSLFIPGEKSVVVVHLAALGLVVVAHVAAAPAWLPRKYFKHSAKIFGKYLRFFAVFSTLIGRGMWRLGSYWFKVLLRQLSYAIKNQLVASKAPY